MASGFINWVMFMESKLIMEIILGRKIEVLCFLSPSDRYLGSETLAWLSGAWARVDWRTINVCFQKFVKLLRACEELGIVKGLRIAPLLPVPDQTFLVRFRKWCRLMRMQMRILNHNKYLEFEREPHETCKSPTHCPSINLTIKWNTKYYGIWIWKYMYGSHK